MATGIRVAFDAVREKAFGDVAAAYSAIGTSTTDYARLICMSNGTDADVYVSIDGTTNHFRIPANGFKLLDLTANKQSNSQLYLSKGTTFYVKRVAGAPSSGVVWIEVMYGSGGK